MYTYMIRQCPAQIPAKRHQLNGLNEACVDLHAMVVEETTELARKRSKFLIDKRTAWNFSSPSPSGSFSGGGSSPGPRIEYSSNAAHIRFAREPGNVLAIGGIGQSDQMVSTETLSVAISTFSLPSVVAANPMM